MKNLKLQLKIKNLFIHLVVWLFGCLVIPFPAKAENGDSIIGDIQPPGWLEKHGETEIGPGFGLINFFSNILRLVTIAAGLFGFINLLLAGFAFISAAGDPEKIKQAQTKIWQSLIGLIIIASSFTLAAIIGWLLFDNPTLIISPRIYGPEGGS
jgi:hypothetical protein